MKRFYTAELERFVEEQYVDDLENPFYKFDPILLYPPEGEEVE